MLNIIGRSKYEVVIVIAVVIISAAISIGIYSARSTMNKGKQLMMELSALRSGITHFIVVNHSKPPSLDALVTGTYDAGNGERQHFVDRVYRNDRGMIIDPFGNEYSYDPETGWVRSTTDDYEKW